MKPLSFKNLETRAYFLSGRAHNVSTNPRSKVFSQVFFKKLARVWGEEPHMCRLFYKNLSMNIGRIIFAAIYPTMAAIPLESKILLTRCSFAGGIIPD